MKFLALLRHSILPVLAISCAMSTSSCALLGVGLNTAIALIPIKLMFKCLPEGTMIDTPDGSQAVEELRAGDLVVGFSGKPVKVLQIQGYLEDSDAKDFLKVEFENGSVVDLCDKHRIHGVRAGSLEVGDRLKSGHVVKLISAYGDVDRSYDILTEDRGYQINGVPVNSMIEEMYEAGHSGKIKE